MQDIAFLPTCLDNSERKKIVDFLCLAFPRKIPPTPWSCEKFGIFPLTLPSPARGEGKFISIEPPAKVTCSLFPRKPEFRILWKSWIPRRASLARNDDFPCFLEFCKKINVLHIFKANQWLIKEVYNTYVSERYFVWSLPRSLFIKASCSHFSLDIDSTHIYLKIRKFTLDPHLNPIFFCFELAERVSVWFS